MLALPVYPELTEEQIQYVAKQMHEVRAEDPQWTDADRTNNSRTAATTRLHQAAPSYRPIVSVR